MNIAMNIILLRQFINKEPKKERKEKSAIVKEDTKTCKLYIVQRR